MNFSPIYEIKSWNENINEFKTKAIYNNSKQKEIQIVLPKGKTMQEHSAPGEIIVQVLKGKIDFTIGNKNICLDELMSIRLSANIKHSLFAKEDSIIRLSLSKKDSLKRVNKVLIN